MGLNKVDAMKKTTSILITTAMLLAVQSAFACDYPTKPDTLPDGNSASKEEMLAGVKMINQYQEKMSTYLDCIEADQVVAMQRIDEEDSEGRERSKELFNQKYNAAVDEQTMVVEQFNAQIRAYKGRSD